MAKHQPKWTPYLLGPNLSQDPGSHHSTIRAYVIEYLFSCVFWLRVFLTIGALAYFADHEGFTRIAPALLLLAFALIYSYSSDHIDYAAALWSRFANELEINDEEFKLIALRAESHCSFNSFVAILNWLIHLSLFVVLIITKGWLFTVAFTLAMFAISSLLQFGLHLYFGKIFRKRLKNTDRYLILYTTYWKNDSDRNSFLMLRISNGDILFSILIAALYIMHFYSYGTPWLTTLFWVSISGLITTILSKRRLVSNSGKEFRKPFAPFLSKFVSKHLTQSLLYDGFWNGFLLLVILKTYPNLSGEWWKLVLVMIPMSFFARFFFTNGTIRVFKRLVDRQFNIVIFRRFSEHNASKIKSTVYPNFGAYGRITSILDSAFESAKSSHSADSEKILGEYADLLYLTDHNWRSHVTLSLRPADLVVFCWLEEITQNMEWEFEETVRLITESRIIFIVSLQSEIAVKSLLNIKFSKKIPDENFIILDNESYRSFGNRVNNILDKLSRSPRPGHSAANDPELARQFMDPAYLRIQESSKIEDNTFHNSYFGLSFKIPADWTIFNEDEVANEQRLAKLIMRKLDLAAIESYNIKPKNLVSLYKYHPESALAATNNCGFQLVFLKRKYFRNITKELYVSQMIQVFNSFTENFKSFKNGNEVVFSKVVFANFYFERDIAGSTSFHRSYVAELKDSLLIVNTYCRNKSSWPEIEKIFATLIYMYEQENCDLI